jgi:hypothetical protein
MVDARDPHFALGIEHATKQLVPYQWADAEHQRRYDAGYARVVARHQHVHDQLQENLRWLHLRWLQRIVSKL